MTTVAVTGHRSLADDLWPWVRAEIDAVLDDVAPPLVGVSGLAEGADQCFAEAVLDRGGRLHAILAFAGFGRSLEGEEARRRFDALVARADPVEVMEPQPTHTDAYVQVGQRLVDLADLLVAVWDGEPARGQGGTAEVVTDAIAAGVPVVHLDTSRHTVIRR